MAASIDLARMLPDARGRWRAVLRLPGQRRPEVSGMDDYLGKPCTLEQLRLPLDRASVVVAAGASD
jgi:hypothetical protein